MCDDDQFPRLTLDANFPRLDPNDGLTRICSDDDFANLDPETAWERILYEHGNGWMMALTGDERDLVDRGLLTHEHWKARQAYRRKLFEALEDKA